MGENYTVMMRFPVFLSIALLVLIPYKTCEGEPSTGPDGVIIWDPLPTLGSFVVEPDQYQTDGDRPDTLASMSTGWLDFIQPHGFPLGKNKCHFGNKIRNPD